MAGLSQYIWFEKYRPRELSDLSLNKEHRLAFKKFISDGEIPHLLLSGPQGSGKTTVAQIFTSHIPCVVLSLNASGEDRGIDTIKGKVKQFAGSKVSSGKIKIVFMDEADAVTPDAQNALKNTMETYSKNCRFILTCNHVDKINKPIQSRCMKFTFDRFPKRKLISLCNSVLEAEGIEDTDQDELHKLIDKFYPDIRSVINSLQAACLSGKFNPKAIGSMLVDPAEICEVITSGSMLTLRNKLAGMTEFVFLYKFMMDYYLPTYEGDTLRDMLDSITWAVRYDPTVPDREINFVGCAGEMMVAQGVKINFKK